MWGSDCANLSKIRPQARDTADMGHDVVSLSLNGADAKSIEAALAGLPGLERVMPEPEALALYVEDGAASIAEIVRLLDRDHIQVGGISVSRPSLDDVFLKATGRRLEGARQSEDGGS